MPESVILACAALVLLAFGLLKLYRSLALRKHWLDHPNERSSHQSPVPGGAGIVLLLVFVLAALAFHWQQGLSCEAVIIVLLAGLLGTLGWADDRYHLPRRLRAAAFLLAASALLLGAGITSVASWMFWLLFVFGFINAFNFMDGIDGFATTEALFFLFSLLMLSGAWQELSLLASLLAACCVAFLLWNWSPAKLFLGDSGSLFIGFLLAALCLLAEQRGVLAWQSGLLLLVLFIAEAGVTFLQRLLAGENVFQAHRSHVYQLLAIRWGSHARVTLSYLAVNLVVVLPLCWIAQSYPQSRTILLLSAYTILCGFVGILRPRLLLSAPEKI